MNTLLKTSLALSLGLSLGAGPLVAAHADDGSGLIIAGASQLLPAGGSATEPQAAGEAVGRNGDSGDVPKLDPVQTAALYYYAKERQTDRVDAEIARLRALYPGFVPPQNLYLAADEIVPDETSLWDLFEADDFTGIDAEIIRRKAEDPGWMPTVDFQSKLARKKQRVRMKELAAAEDWIGLADLSASIDSATETDVDLIWMQIDALSATGNRDALAKSLRRVLLRDGAKRLSDEHLVVTLQKALRDFPAAEIEKLAAVLWPHQSESYLPAPVALDIARKQIAEFNAEKDAAPVPSASRQLLELEARKIRRPEDLSLLGWHDIKVEQPRSASEWFAIAMEVQPGPQNAKGMYLSLERQKLDREAYEFAATHLPDLSDDPVFLMNVLSARFGNPGEDPIGEEAVLAYSTAIMETSAADHAEILGWYAYNSRQFEASEAWFRQSYAWEASADRLKGLALALRQSGNKRGFAALKRDFAEVYPEIWSEIAAASAPKGGNAASVKTPAREVRASYVKHFEAKNYPACLRDIDRLGSGGSKPSVAVIRGWCEIGLKRFSDARISFERGMAGKGQVRADAVYGAALALLGSRLTDEAEALISAYPVSATRDRELRAEIYYQRARSAFDHQQFDRVLNALDARAQLVAEPRDLMQMRGWAYYHSGQSARATAVFKQLNMVIRDTSALAAIGLINNKEGR
ncbi:hypothetical protein [Hoeflea sp.]|uniref:hypothetical protein n=1 Tax=Hoeflea sp. TaxID=1940281 RepID=UPI0037485935